MRKTHKNNKSINCDTLYTIQTSKTMIGYTDIMKKTMTNKTTTSYSALADRDYTRKVYPLNNSVNQYLHKFYIQNNRRYFAVQKRKQVKKRKEDALFKSSNIESVALSSECTSDEIHARIDSQRLTTTALLKLKPREERIIRMRFGINCKNEEGYTLQEVADSLNICRQRVREIEAKALRNMSHPSTALKLKSFLEC